MKYQGYAIVFHPKEGPCTVYFTSNQKNKFYLTLENRKTRNTNLLVLDAKWLNEPVDMQTIDDLVLQKQ